MQPNSTKRSSSTYRCLSLHCAFGSLTLISTLSILTLTVAIMWWYGSIIISCFLLAVNPVPATTFNRPELAFSEFLRTLRNAPRFAATTFNQPELTFSDLLGTLPIAPHFENLTLHHPLYEGIGNGNLPVETFKAFLQQDRLYVNLLFDQFQIMANREEDPHGAKYLESIANDRDSWDKLFDELYDDFKIPKTKQITPATLDYAGKQHILATNDDLSVALASATPCFTLWFNIGAHWKSLNATSRTANPYRKFVDRVAQESPESQKQFLDFVDGYYARLNGSKPKELAVKQRMLDAYTESIQLEYRFASALINARPFNATSKAFTDMTSLILPEIQGQVINHPLYTKIGLGTLSFETYKVLIQQDYLYMRGFYRAYEYMERKEPNVELKAPLRKNGQDFYDFFESEFKKFSFGPASATEPYALEYLNHDIRIGRDRPVAEGVASTFPCYWLWFEFGGKINEIAAEMGYAKHPYQTFLDSVKPSYNVDSVDKAKKTLNGYYEKASLEGKYRILQVIRQSIFHELDFANGVYGQQYHY